MTHINQDQLILNILRSGSAFTDVELTKATTSSHLLNINDRRTRGIISTLRKKGYPIASKNVINEVTGRLNKAYYWEQDKAKYIQWCLNNGYFEFKKGAPK
jgi:hypothetical protein